LISKLLSVFTVAHSFLKIDYVLYNFVIEETRLRWFGHVKRIPGNRLPLKILEWEPEGTRRRGRPKERWKDGVRRSMTNHAPTEEDTRDRDRWRNLVLGEGKPL
jgi:hypothetical protein